MIVFALSLGGGDLSLGTRSFLMCVRTPNLSESGSGRSGHIPGAVHLHADLLRTADGAFKDEAALRQLFQGSDVLPEHNVVTYCTVGARASEVALVLRYLLGYPNIRVYDGP